MDEIAREVHRVFAVAGAIADGFPRHNTWEGGYGSQGGCFGGCECDLSFLSPFRPPVTYAPIATLDHAREAREVCAAMRAAGGTGAKLTA